MFSSNQGWIKFIGFKCCSSLWLRRKNWKFSNQIKRNRNLTLTHSHNNKMFMSLKFSPIKSDRLATSNDQCVTVDLFLVHRIQVMYNNSSRRKFNTGRGRVGWFLLLMRRNSKKNKNNNWNKFTRFWLNYLYWPNDLIYFFSFFLLPANFHDNKR